MNTGVTMSSKIIISHMQAEGFYTLCDVVAVDDSNEWITGTNFLQGWQSSKLYNHVSNVYAFVDLNVDEVLWYGETGRYEKGVCGLKLDGSPYLGRSSCRLNDYFGKGSKETKRINIVLERIAKGHKIVIMVRPLEHIKKTYSIFGKMVEKEVYANVVVEAELIEGYRLLTGERPVGNGNSR